MARLEFDASQVEPQAGFEVIPPGWYNVMIDESEMRPTRDNTSEYLQLRYTVIDGQYANRKLFERLHIANANPVAREIAYKQLSAIAHSVGVLQVADSQQLHGIPLKVKVRIRKDPDGFYDDQNDVRDYKSMNEQTPSTNSAQGGATPPWAGQARPAAQQRSAPAAAAPPAQQPAQHTTAAAAAQTTPAAAAGADDRPPWMR
jgi:Protein of unknown function (DUF669)